MWEFGFVHTAVKKKNRYGIMCFLKKIECSLKKNKNRMCYVRCILAILGLSPIG